MKIVPGPSLHLCPMASRRRTEFSITTSCRRHLDQGFWRGKMTVKRADHNYRQRTNGTSLTGGKGMGLVYADIQLTNEDDLAFYRRGWASETELRRITTRALVDSGALDLVI